MSPETPIIQAPILLLLKVSLKTPLVGEEAILGLLNLLQGFESVNFGKAWES